MHPQNSGAGGTQAQAPTNPQTQTSSDTEQRGDRAVWVALLVLNLPLPLWLGWDVVNEFGRCGLIAAIVFVWLLGHLTVHRLGDWLESLLFGGVCTALLQFFPVVHLVAGLIGLDLALRLDPAASSSRASAIGGFLATVFTAAQLLVVAFVIGETFRAVARLGESASSRGRS
jgi:hypothetical protein